MAPCSMLMAQGTPPAAVVDGLDPSGGGNDLDALLDLADKDIGNLSQVRVTAPALQAEVSTVSRQTSTVGRTPAAVFVITNEMIRRSGARSIPEVLRMAPGVNVARIDANKWAVSIRGMNGRFANKLLVQIDGRTVYTPLFGGVFWDVQDVLLEDVERIEIVRGPGATVWGANAVNGVINILTKNAADTQGAFVQGGGGTEERGFVGARYGATTPSGTAWRVYGKGFDRDTGRLPDTYAHGHQAFDQWSMGRGGFRADWSPTCCDKITVQGDYYNGQAGSHSLIATPSAPFSHVALDNVDVVGGNGLVRWTHELGDDSDWAFQTYYDRTERDLQDFDFREDRETFDVDFQHRFPLGWRHRVIWGLGYRNLRDKTRGGFALTLDPDRRSDDLFSYFLQDEITLCEDRWYLTVGSKFSHGDYSPFEFQPTARLLWTPSERHSIWASVSRAVRTPTRADENVVISQIPDAAAPGVFPTVIGNRNTVSEDLMAYEAGIRVQPRDEFSWDLAAFYHQYEDLQTFAMGAPFLDLGPPAAFRVPLTLTNDGRGHTYGFELAANYELTECWRLFGAYTFFRDEYVNFESGSSPRNQFYFQSSWNFCCDWEFDAMWRYVDNLPGQDIAAYNAIDLRLAWQATPTLEFSAVARHLLDSHHLEFGSDTFSGNQSTEVESAVYGMATWRY
ncbi:MAG: TonB-dependent receptor [Planctomycetales bacterium]|nr:TonB-dependent receptor [Planctomycetales bacterium]